LLDAPCAIVGYYYSLLLTLSVLLTFAPFLFVLTRSPPSSTLFPYTTLFRSDPHLAVPRAHGANARRRFCRALCRNRPAPHLNLTRTIAMYHQIHTYTELQQQIHDDLRIQHPEWVESNGESPMCDSYESRLTEL